MDWQPVQHSPKPMDGLISVMTFVLWSRCCALNVHIIKKEKKTKTPPISRLSQELRFYLGSPGHSLSSSFWRRSGAKEGNVVPPAHLPPGLLPTGHAGNVEISELWGDVRIRWLFAPQSSFIPSTSWARYLQGRLSSNLRALAISLVLSFLHQSTWEVNICCFWKDHFKSAEQ